MAVENKFKLNVIAASVLMGLSLSAMAAGNDNAGDTGKGAVTATPTKVKSLAEAAGTIKPEDISVTVNAVSMKLDEALKAADGTGSGAGKDTSAKKEYIDAVTAYGKLNADEQKKITELKSAKSAFDAASADFKMFDDKSSAVNAIYNSKLTNLYGNINDSAGHAWNINTGNAADGHEASIARNGNKNTIFSDYTDSLGAAKTGLKDLLVALDKQAFTSAGGTSGVTDDAKKAHEAVQAYFDYLSASYNVAQEQQKQAAAENYIQEKLPAFLKVVEQYKNAVGNTGDDKLEGKYNKYIEAVKNYRDAEEKDKPSEKTNVYNALKELVEVAGTATIPASDTGSSGEITGFTKDFGAAHTIWDAAAKQLGTVGNLVSTLDAAKDLTAKAGDLPSGIPLQITSKQEALTGIETYLHDLIQAAEAKGDESSELAAALQKTKDASKTFKEKQAAYNAALDALNAAGSERLALVAEWKQLNDNWTKTADALNAAEKAYKGSDAKTAADKLEQKKTGYIATLDNTSSAIQTALDKAKQDYIDAVKKEGSAKTQQDKNAALYSLIAHEKMLIPAKLQMDKALLELKKEDVNSLQEQLSQAEKNRADAEVSYNAAVKEYLDAKKKFDETSTVADEVAVSVAEKKLLSLTGGSTLGDLYKDQSKGIDSGFKQYKEFTAAPAITSLTSARNDLSDGNKDIPKARKNVAEGLNHLASLMPLSTADEQKTFRTAYIAALKDVGVAATTAEAQGKAPGAGKVTHILGSLTKEEIAQYNPVSGNYKSVIVDVDSAGNITGVKDKFTAKDLYTGTQDTPFTTTVLDIRALELGNGKLADTNTITVGEAGSKATPVEVWAKTAGKEATPAVKLSGDLRTATAQLDENGKPMDGQVVRGADQIHLQNVNIHNSFTLADKVQMLKDDMEALNKEAADKIALGQPATGVNDWLKNQSGLLNSKYDKLNLTGLQIATTTVNPEFDVDNGVWTTAAKTVIPTDPNILLDNLNITLQNDSVDGTSTAIALSGTGNHILANGGVFDAGKAGNLAEANVLDITGADNLVEFRGSTLKGDIRSDATGNTVNLTNGSLLAGNAIAVTGNLHLNLDNSTWNGGVGPNSPDVSLSNNSVWNVKGYHASVNALSLSGSNSINLINSDGLAQLGGHGFTGEKSAVILSVDTDLTSDGKGVTSVLAGTYSPDSLHSLTGTGLADNYQFGTLHVNGLATGGKYALSVESAGAEPYTIGGRLADGADGTSAHAFVSYKTSESRVVTGQDGKPVSQNVTSDADFTSLSAPAELGVYQYAAEKVMDGVNNRTNIYYRSTGQLSNSAATVVSLAAAPVDVANLESDTLAKHMNSVRHGKDSGVWVSYFGGENRNSTASGPEYKLKTNGVMLGADTLTENNWLAGVAVSSARSDMSVMNSSGDLNSYGAQFYMSRRYDSGVFVDSALQFNHFSNTAKARMINGQPAKADFSGNSYGLEAKVGYAWNSEGFFAEPYVRAAARAFDGEHYALSNGMTVNSNDYKSMLGEVGTDLGYQYAINGGYVKPYLHLAALNEFADGNSVRVNNVTLDDSVKGAAFQAGLGAEVKVTDNLGGYAAFDYTKGDNTERPWQATVGVNYTW
ncbi:TPA: autotransporter outer membrane beta-barrel domain-containing protein [Salmonella enterica subsp. diarizonae serovar 48:i:z]